MQPLNLPESLLKFIESGNQLQFDAAQCEAGTIELRAPGELKLERLPVSVYGTEFESANPQRGETGFYYPLVVPLTKGDFVTYAVLLWLPREQRFGSYDDEHRLIVTFPDASWAAIVADPLLYLNAHWEPETAPGAAFNPWPAHPFREGVVSTQVEKNREV